jgi:hypothetical protein
VAPDPAPGRGEVSATTASGTEAAEIRAEFIPGTPTLPDIAAFV